jgi:hypothetical protein
VLLDDRKSRTFSASGYATFATGSALPSLAPFVPMVQSTYSRQRDDFRHDGAIQVFDNEQVTIWDVTWEKGYGSRDSADVSAVFRAPRKTERIA